MRLRRNGFYYRHYVGQRADHKGDAAIGCRDNPVVAVDATEFTTWLPKYFRWRAEGSSKLTSSDFARAPTMRANKVQGNRMNVEQRSPHPRPLSPKGLSITHNSSYCGLFDLMEDEVHLGDLVQ
jgi:hypothetical protein